MTLIIHPIKTDIPDFSAYLSQVFKGYPDLIGYEGTHPLIHRFLFEKESEEEELLQEIQWVFEGLYLFEKQDILDFIIELRGLKLMVIGFQLQSWEEILMTQKAEKKAFLPLFKQIIS